MKIIVIKEFQQVSYFRVRINNRIIGFMDLGSVEFNS